MSKKQTHALAPTTTTTAELVVGDVVIDHPGNPIDRGYEVATIHRGHENSRIEFTGSKGYQIRSNNAEFSVYRKV